MCRNNCIHVCKEGPDWGVLPVLGVERVRTQLRTLYADLHSRV